MIKSKYIFGKIEFVHRAAAAVTAGFMTFAYSLPSEAAITTAKSVVTNITASTSHFPNLISTMAYTGGIGLGVAAIYKLKQHGDNPHSVPIKDGLIRLVVCGALLSLPFMTGAMKGTFAPGWYEAPEKMFFADAATASTDVCYWHPSYCGM